jgi:high-affinity iron transporter
VQHAGDLRRAGASEEVEAGLVELLDMVLSRRSVDEVRSRAGDLVLRLFEELDFVNLPQAVPDLDRGRAMYAANCAACHGSSGAGDGPSSPGMDPPATSFRDARMNLIAPHQVFGATTFGIDGTAMPNFGWTVPAEEIWDVSFYIMTLREGFDPRRPDPAYSITLADLATRSNEQLLGSVRKTREDAELWHVDFYRRNIPPW